MTEATPDGALVPDASIAERLADDLLDTIATTGDSPVYQPPRAAVLGLVHLHLEMFGHWLDDQQPPDESQIEMVRGFGRAIATAGLPMDMVPAYYRRAAHLVWREHIERLPEPDGAAVIEIGRRAFGWVDLVTEVFMSAYSQAVDDTPLTEAERAAQTTFARLCHDEPLLPSDHELLETLDLDPQARLRAFVVTLPDVSVQRHAAVARSLRRVGALAVAQGPRVIGVSARQIDFLGAGIGGDAVWSVAPVASRAVIESTIGQLRTVVHVAARSGVTGLVDVEHHLLLLLLASSPEIAARIHRQIYQSLEPELAATLDAYVESDFDRNVAATALPVHRNTMRRRLIAIASETGVDIDSREGRTLATLAWLQSRASQWALPPDEA